MVLQMTAWTGMVVVRSQDRSVAEAVETTFDGKHPCRLCHAIDAGQEEEKKPERELPASKAFQDAKFYAATEIKIPSLAEAEMEWPMWEVRSASRRDPPLIPPPRA